MNTLRIIGLLSACVTVSAWAGKPTGAGSPEAAKKPAAAAAAHEHGENAHREDCHHPPLPGDQEAKAERAKQAEKSSASSAQGWVLTRGEKLGEGPVVTVGELLTSAAKQEGKTVRVEGKVRKACERKGCWMELAQDEKSPGVRVTFKDYGFFVPVDSAGSQARVEGTVTVAQLSEERAKHYESEGAIVPRGKDGKAQEVQLVATGVELRR